MERVTYIAPERIPVNTREDIWIEPGKVVGSVQMLHKNLSLNTFTQSSGAFRKSEPQPDACDGIQFEASRRMIYGDFAKGQFIEVGTPVAVVNLSVESVEPNRFFGLISQGKLVTSMPQGEEAEEEAVL